MLLAEIVKGIILEGKASSFLRFYDEIGRGYNPDNAILFDCLKTLEKYYEDYLQWYKDYPRKKQEDAEVYPHFVKRLQEIKVALQSDDVKRKIIAIDNGINQWHIDYPVVYHLQMDAEGESDDEDPDNPANVEVAEWFEISDLLVKLGKLKRKGPYRRIYEAFPKPQSDLYHITTTSAIKDGKLTHPTKKSLFFSRLLTKEMKDWGDRMVAKYGGELILVKLPYKNINKYLWREGQGVEGDFLYTFSDIDRNDIEIIKL